MRSLRADALLQKYYTVDFITKKKAPKKITEFDNVLFAMLVDKIIVHKDKTLEMVWKGNA